MKPFLLAISTVCLFSVTAIASPVSENVASDDTATTDAVRDIHQPKDTSFADFSALGFMQKRDPINIEKRKHKKNKKKHDGKKNKVDSKHYPNSGKGTFFSPNRGSCGWKNSKKDLIVAVNEHDMKNKKHKSDKNPNCGRMVEIVNEKGDKVKAKVADTCPECSKGDLDLSPAAFKKLAPFKQGIVKIRWKYI